MNTHNLDDAVAVVADPNTSAQVLNILADTHPTLRSAIALHPNATPALLDVLDSDADPSLKSVVAIARKRMTNAEPGARAEAESPSSPTAQNTPASAEDGPPAAAPDKPVVPVESVIATARGNRCGRCSTYLARGPNERQKVCPSCGTLNKVAPQDFRPLASPTYQNPIHATPASAPASYGYAAPFSVGPAAEPWNGVAVGGLAVGIISLVFCWVPVLGIILGLVAVVLGGIGMSRANNGGGGKGMAITGLILGAVAVVIGLIATIAILSAASS